MLIFIVPIIFIHLEQKTDLNQEKKFVKNFCFVVVPLKTLRY